MSAETLRKAAALMRARAKGVQKVTDVTAKPWWSPNTLMVNKSVSFMEDAEHIASWHPAVALAVADWLDIVAARAEDMAGTIGSPHVAETVVAENITGYLAAQTVARTYLGES